MGSIEVSGNVHEAADDITIEEAMHSIGLHPDSYLYLISGKPVPMDTLVGGNKVKAVRVASGG